MTEQDLINAAIDLLKLSLSFMVGGLVTAKITEYRLSKFLKNTLTKYGITELRVQHIGRALAEFFGVEI